MSQQIVFFPVPAAIRCGCEGVTTWKSRDARRRLLHDGRCRLRATLYVQGAALCHLHAGSKLIEIMTSSPEGGWRGPAEDGE